MLTVDQHARNPTPRQRRILRRLAEGMSQPEIAAQDGVPAHRIARQLEALRNRFAPTNCALIAIAIRLQWIPVEIEIS
jgi:DNA-binding CsgD family transcriptional regulator